MKHLHPKGKTGKKSLHARVCPKKTYTSQEFVEHVAAFEHLPKNRLRGTCCHCRRSLLSACRWKHCGIRWSGFFSTSLKCLKDTDDDEDEIKPKSIAFQNVHLRISSEFRKRIKHEMKFQRVHSLTRRQKIVNSTVKERMKKMVSFLKINICITRKEYIGLTGFTPYEAMNELNDFISQGLLRRRGAGRSVVYGCGGKC